jgi:hypothetical protein
LTPALSETLFALRSGDGEKQAADRLQIGLYTLHDRVRRLYRAFGVHSRAELLARTALLFSPRPRLQAEKHRGRPVTLISLAEA